MAKANLFETPEILTGFDAPSSPMNSRPVEMGELMSPLQKRTYKEQAISEVSGSFTPSVTKLRDIAQNENGFWNTTRSSFNEGVIGYSLGIALDQVDFETDEELRRASTQYARDNGFKSFAASLIGRSVSDLPIDIAVAAGTGALGATIKYGARAGSIAASTLKKLDRSVDTLQALAKAGKPSYFTGSWKNAKRQFVEGLLAGAISESALQNMGKYGDTKAIVRASIEDAIGGVVLGEFFRGVGYTFKRKKLAQEWASATAENTGMNKTELTKEFNTQLEQVLIPQTAKAGRFATEGVSEVTSTGLKTTEEQLTDVLRREVSPAQREFEEVAFADETLRRGVENYEDAEFKLLLEQEQAELKALQEKERVLLGQKLGAERAKEVNTDRFRRNLERARQRTARLEASQRKITERLDKSARERGRLIDLDVAEKTSLRRKLAGQSLVNALATRASSEQKYLDSVIEDALFVDFELNKALQEMRRPDAPEQLDLPAGPEPGTRALPSGERSIREFQEGFENYKQRVMTEDFGRKLLGSTEDLQALSKSSGIPVPELETLRSRAFDLMRQDQAERGGMVRPNTEAMQARPAPEGQTLKNAELEKVVEGKHIRNAQELVDAAMHFGRGMEDPKGHALMLLEVFKARAEISGKNLDEYLKDKAMRYMDTEGNSHIIFDDANTIIKASRNAEDMGDFFHEIGHVLEQDLTMADRRILANLLFPNNKGKLRDVNLFGRGFSETFANHFVTYLRQGIDAQRYSKAEKGLFNKIVRWLKNVGGAIFGKKYDSGPMHPKVVEVFDRLFKSDQVVELEMNRSEFVAAGRVARKGDKKLESTSSVEASRLIAEEQLTQELGKAPTQKQINRRAKRIRMAEKTNQFSVAGENAEEIHKGIKALTEDGEIESSPLAKSKVWRWFRENAPQIATTGVMTMRTILQNMGETGKKLYAGVRAGKTEEFRILGENYDIYRKSAETAGFTREDSMKLKELDDKAEIKVRLGGEERSVGVLELINLHLYARDGLAPGKTAEARSAHKALLKHGYQLKDTTETIKLTEAELADIGTQEGLQRLVGKEAGPAAVRAVNTIKNSLKEMGSRYHKWLEETTGEGGFDPSREYWMKKAIKDVNSDEKYQLLTMPDGSTINIFDATADELSQKIANMVESGHVNTRKLLQTIADITPINKVRKGGGILQYQNSFNAMSNYMHQQSRLMGMAEPLANLQVTIKNSKVKDQMVRHIGKDVYEALDVMTKNVVGLRDTKTPFDKTWSNRIYKGQVLSALSWNLSPIFKQLPAVMTSLARMDLPPGTNRFAEAQRLLTESITKRNELHEDMMKRFPSYHIRYVDSGVSPDMSDVSLSGHSDHVLFGDISLSDGFKGGFSAGFKNFVEKGMTGIREADAATIRAVYLGVENNLRAKGELNGKSPEEIDALIEDVASEIIDETQGASHAINRTVSQSSDSFFERQVAMFSSEATQQFNMILRDWNSWKSLPEGAEKQAAWDRLKLTGTMLSFNALGVAAAGSAAGMIKGEALDLLNSEEYQQKRDQYLENMGLEYARYKGQLADAFIGVIPYSGPMMGELLKATLIGDSFEQDLLPFGVLNDLQEAAESFHNDELALRHVMKNAANILGLGFGLPGTVSQIATSAVR